MVVTERRIQSRRQTDYVCQEPQDIETLLNRLDDRSDGVKLVDRQNGVWVLAHLLDGRVERWIFEFDKPRKDDPGHTYEVGNPGHTYEVSNPQAAATQRPKCLVCYPSGCYWVPC